MELIKFLNDYGDYFSFRKLESDSGMSERSLGKVLKGERNIPIKSIPKLLGIFSSMGIDLKYDRIDKRKKPVKIDTEHEPLDSTWRSIGYGYFEKNGIKRKPVRIDGVPMMRV